MKKIVEQARCGKKRRGRGKGEGGEFCVCVCVGKCVRKETLRCFARVLFFFRVRPSSGEGCVFLGVVITGSSRSAPHREDSPLVWA